MHRNYAMKVAVARLAHMNHGASSLTAVCGGFMLSCYTGPLYSTALLSKAYRTWEIHQKIKALCLLPCLTTCIINCDIVHHSLHGIEFMAHLLSQHSTYFHRIHWLFRSSMKTGIIFLAFQLQ